MTIWLYEVYKIQYDANGATLPDNVTAPAEKWKWHGTVCLLEKNVYKKETDNHVSLIQNGWNTARSGDGNNYPNGSYYRENASQVFYANFFTENDVVYKIDWIITDGRTTYCLAQDTGNWFNVDLASNANRETGVFVMQGDLIVLSQIIEDEEHNKLWSGSLFGNYSIRGWYAVGDDWSIGDDITNGNEYYLNMTATSDYTFVADITSRTGQEIQCVFVDDQDNEICSSGTIAGDARPYMALSGMDIATINNYREGYDKWVEHYGPFDKLPRSATGLNNYSLGAKIIETEIPSEKEEEAKSGNDYIAMMIVLLLGAGSSIASLTIYLLMRKKNFTINLKRFKGKF